MKYATGSDGKQLAFPDGIDSGVMANAVAKYNQNVLPINSGSITNPHGPSGSKLFGIPMSKDFQRGAANVLHALPFFGGVAGDIGGAAAATAVAPTSAGASLLTAPALMAGGSAAGQAAGRAAELGGRSLIGLPPPADMNPAGVGADIAGQAGIGAASSLVGQAAGGVVRGAAKRLMAGSLATTDKAAVEAALSRNISPGTSILTGKTAETQAGDQVSKAVEQQTMALDLAHGQKVSMPTMPLLSKLDAFVSNVEKRAQTTVNPELDKVALSMRDQYDRLMLALKGSKINPYDAQTFKEEYAKLARGAYESADKGKVLSDHEKKMFRMIADDMRSWLNKSVPGYTKPTKVLDELVSLEPALAKSGNTINGITASPAQNPLKMIPAGIGGRTSLFANRVVSPALRSAPWLLQAPGAFSGAPSDQPVD
jgi:hypothetical protein